MTEEKSALDMSSGSGSKFPPTIPRSKDVEEDATTRDVVGRLTNELEDDLEASRRSSERSTEAKLHTNPQHSKMAHINYLFPLRLASLCNR